MQRATLDVIGLAGFSYDFRAVEMAGAAVLFMSLPTATLTRWSITATHVPSMLSGAAMGVAQIVTAKAARI